MTLFGGAPSVVHPAAGGPAIVQYLIVNLSAFLPGSATSWPSTWKTEHELPERQVPARWNVRVVWSTDSELTMPWRAAPVRWFWYSTVPCTGALGVLRWASRPKVPFPLRPTVMKPPPLTLLAVSWPPGGPGTMPAIFATKASSNPPLNIVSKAPAVVGKSVDWVMPTT